MSPFYYDKPNMTKPVSIQSLEDHLGLTFVLDETHDPAIFGRYGRRVIDACRYWMRDGVVAGLCARASGITNIAWINAPEWADLEVLLLGENNFPELVIPATMTKMWHLDLNDSPELTTVRFLGSPPRLRRLEATDCPKLTTFEAPANCPELHYFDLNGCALTSFSLDGDFRTLVYLDLTQSPQLKEFSLAGDFASLLSLHLRAAAQLTQISLTASLPALDTLDLHGTNVSELPANAILNCPLYRLYAHGCTPKNCPAAFLEADGNVLDNVRSWFQALQAGSEKNRIVKLLINGNGNVGKSTLWCALKNEKESACTCDDHETTHGIELTMEALTLDEVDFRGWDFGGQEIYQGTHRLFLTDGAVQALVLDYVSEQAAETGELVPDRSNTDPSTPDQLVRNFPLEHFYIRQKALGPRSKFLVVQTKKGGGHKRHPAALKLEEEENIKYEFLDAKAINSVRSLRRDLEDLAKELPIYGMPFPSSWVKVRHWLADVLKANANATTPLRVIDRSDFRAHVVKEFQVTEDDQMIEALLIFLHAAGDVYVNKEHLKEKIIIDLSWALEGVYRPLRRGDFQRDAKDAAGKLFIDKIYPNTTGSERDLLLEFMQSCGMCFPADREIDRNTASEYYIFPAFLPEQPDLRVESSWRALPNAPTWSATLPYRDLPAIHALICDLGRKTTQGQLWHSGIDLFLIDAREQDSSKESLPEAHGKIELTDAPEGEHGCQLVVTLDTPGATVWLPSIQEWVGEHFKNLEWQANETARTQVQVFQGRGGEKFSAQQLLDQTPKEIRVAFCISNHPRFPQIDHKEERAQINQQLTGYTIHLAHKSAITEDQLAAAVDRASDGVNVLHFVGHGEKKGIYLYDDEHLRSEKLLTTNELKTLLRLARKTNPLLTCVVLNACLSQNMAKAASEVGLYAIGTTDEVQNKEGTYFSAGFYKSLARNPGDYELAFTHGKTFCERKINRNVDDLFQFFPPQPNIND